MSKITQRLNLGYAKVFRPTMVQRHIREWPDRGPTVARQRPTGPDTPTVRAQPVRRFECSKMVTVTKKTDMSPHGAVS